MNNGLDYDLNAPVRDVTLPNGEVRHNVGSDNLSDEDRRAMDADLDNWIKAGCPE